MSTQYSRRQFLRASGGIIAFATIAACVPPAVAPVASESDTVEASVPTRARVVVNHWHNWAEPVDQRLIEFANRFNEIDPGIEVVPLFVGNMATVNQRVVAALAAGDPPQLANGFPYSTQDYVEADAIVAAEEFLFGEGGLDAGSFWPNTPVELTYQDTIWAIPVTNVLPLLFYNRAHFAEAGVESAPETWEDLRAAAAATTKTNNGVVEQWGFAVTTSEPNFLNFAYQNGAQYLTDDNTQIAINSPEGIETLEFLAGLVLVDQSAPPDLTDGEDPFKANLLAMNITTPTGIQRYRDAGLDFDVVRIPYNRDRASLVTGNVWYAFKNVVPESLAAAQEYVQWFLSPEVHGEWIPQIGHLPVLRSAADSQAYQQYLAENPGYQIAVDELEVATALPPRRNAAELTTEFRASLEAAMRGAQTAEEALNAFAETGNGLLAG